MSKQAPSKPLPSPFEKDGQLKHDALKNIIAALVTKMGGTVELTWEELQKTNNSGFYYPMSDTSMVLTVHPPERRYGNA